MRLASIAISLLSLVSISAGQSLGDFARQQRAEQAAETTDSPKVITNADIVHDPEDDDKPVRQSHNQNYAKPFADKSEATAKMYKSQILAQKKSIADLQKQMDALNASVHYATSNIAYNTAQHNERQAEKQQRVEQMRQQLEAAQKQLEEMQEAARRAGFGNGVYDP